MAKDSLGEIDFAAALPNPSIGRRDFLKLAGGIVVFFTLGDSLAQAQDRRRDEPADFNAFLRIGGEGRVACFTGKIEMGQGIITSLAQMLADELDISLDAVDMVMGDTDLCPWDMGTFGSRTTRFFGPQLRAAGAEAKRVLLELAAEHLQLPVGRLDAENGAVFDRSDRQRRVSYAELAGGARIERHVREPVPVKKPSEFRVIGRPVTRRDALEKVTGRAKYAGDIRLHGMVYARILRPPAHGARLLDVDLSGAAGVDGVQIVREGDFIAVLHAYPDVAEKALGKIKATFDRPAADVDENSIFAHLLEVAPEGEVVAQEGDLQKGESRATAIFAQTYLDGYVAHAPMEPHTAVVEIEGDRATVWASTQTPFRARDEVAEELGIPPGNVRVIPPFVGGGFGGKTRNLQVVEAARLARLNGKPVQVAWSREEEFFNDSFRPAAVVEIRSGITEEESIGFWDYHVYFAGQRGAQHFYDIPHYATMAHGSGWGGTPGSHPFATGAWRAPANNTNTFARESQIDIMAAAAGMDPWEFRMKNLSDTRMRCVLEAAAERFGWTPTVAPGGRGHGVACGVDAGTYVATMVEVRVDKGTGFVRVERVVCAQDMGLVINPEGAEIQMEGCITMGLGYALAEDIRFRGGEILDRNFDTYEIPRFSWLPEIETVLIDDPDADPQGGGEPAIITMGGAIANAIYDAVGARVFQLPMTPERVREAIEKG